MIKHPPTDVFAGSYIGRAARFAVCLVLVAGSPFACDSERAGFSEAPKVVFPEADAEPVGTPDCTSKVRCSRDLHSVVDACDESRIVKSCPPEQGCADGACVPACDASVSSSASVGCEFAALPPGRVPYAQGSCFAAFVANTWGTPARIEAEYAGKSLDITASGRIVRTSPTDVAYEPFSGEIQPGEVAVLFLAQAPTSNGYWSPCPAGVTPGVLADTSVLGTTRGSSFRIRSSAPVSAYSMYPFGGADSYSPSATLLLPVSAWKSDYIVTNAWEFLPLGAYKYNPTTQIVAAEDDTEVTIVAPVNIESGNGVEGAGKSAPHTYRLSRNEFLQFAQREELTGSRISANKGIAVMGGHDCMRIPSENQACDTAQLQLFPVRSWGHEYVAVPHLSRRGDGQAEEYFYRIVAAVDGTALTYEPAAPANAPATLQAGGASFLRTREPFVLRSQDEAHPIAVYAYMSSTRFALADFDDGDPEFTFVIPVDQYLDHYVFYVDPTFGNSQLVIVRARAEGKDFEPVMLDCAGELGDWTPVGTQGKYEFTRVRLTKKFVHQSVGTGVCGPGRHEIDSRGPVAMTVWGTDTAASYAYPGGSALRTLNSVETIIR
ncbi:MAG: hypothetical protein K0S65_952 [Labilithrix sp.]|nr:hypothetical protein [Labilithrix sp.]